MSMIAGTRRNGHESGSSTDLGGRRLFHARRSVAVVSVLLFTAGLAQAVDGCKVLLCLAGNWKNISQCKPDVEKALKDVALGHGWPTCGMSGAGNNSSFQWTTEQNCPPFYSWRDPNTNNWMGCQFAGIVSVSVNNAPWSDLFWNTDSGPTSTHYYDQARSALGSNIDPTYDNDAAAYVPPPEPQPIAPESGG